MKQDKSLKASYDNQLIVKNFLVTYWKKYS